MLTNLHNLHVSQTFVLLQICPAELEGPSQIDPPGWPGPSGQGAILVQKELSPRRARSMEAEPPCLLWLKQPKAVGDSCMKEVVLPIAGRPSLLWCLVLGSGVVRAVWGKAYSNGREHSFWTFSATNNPTVTRAGVFPLQWDWGDSQGLGQLEEQMRLVGLDWKLSTLEALEGGRSCHYGTGWGWCISSWYTWLLLFLSFNL